MRTVAVLPVKALGLGNSRLGLAQDERERLGEELARRALTALVEAERVDAVVVVSTDPRVRALAETCDAEVVPQRDKIRIASRRVRFVDEGEVVSHARAAALGIAAALEDGAERVLCAPIDCPAMTAADVDVLLRDALRPGVTVVPDRHGEGTNALVLEPPDAIEPSFGPGSRARHEALAARAGAPCRMLEVPALALDVDTPADLEAARCSSPAP